MIFTLFALIGFIVVARFLFALIFPLLAMRIRLALLVGSITKLAEQQTRRADTARSRSNS